MHGLSLVAASVSYSSLRCAGFSLRWLLLLWSRGPRRMGFSSCSTRACRLCSAGSVVALWHVGSSRTRAWTHVPCTGRRILNHCTAREVHYLHKFFFFFLESTVKYLILFIYYPKQSTDSTQAPSNHQWHSSQNQNKKILKFVWRHKTPRTPKQSFFVF